MKNIRTYQLYSDGYGFDSTYRHQRFMIDVRAYSFRQAVWLAGNRRMSDGTSVGITHVDHNEGPLHAKKFFDLAPVSDLKEAR